MLRAGAWHARSWIRPWAYYRTWRTRAADLSLGGQGGTGEGRTFPDWASGREAGRARNNICYAFLYALSRRPASAGFATARQHALLRPTLDAMQCAEDSPRTGAKTGSQPRNFLIGRNKLNSQEQPPRRSRSTRTMDRERGEDNR